MKKCPVCKKAMFNSFKTCSRECAAKLCGSFDWDKIDLYDLFISKRMSRTAIAEIVGCSHSAVTKRLKKLNFIPVEEVSTTGGLLNRVEPGAVPGAGAISL